MLDKDLSKPLQLEGLDQLADQLYRLKIPLPNNPLRAVHAYLIKGAPHGRSLLIDTGFNEPESLQYIHTVLAALHISTETLDILTTHLHSDHCGLMHELASPSSVLYASVIDADLINQMTTDVYWQSFSALFTLLGLEADAIAFEDHPGYKYCPKTPMVFQTLREGDRITYGPYTLEVYETPGHTPGHLVLFEPNLRWLFSGDHILPKITPNIAFWGFSYGDVLGSYLDQLDRIGHLSPERTFAAHRGIIEDTTQRIHALKAHHEDRLVEILQILKEAPGPLTARTVAAQMHWDLSIKDFEAFPKAQKWFATAEAMSHLVALEKRGLVTMTVTDRVVFAKALSDLTSTFRD